MISEEDRKEIMEMIEERVRSLRIGQQEIIPYSVKQGHIDGYIIFRGLAADIPSDGNTEKQVYYEEDTQKLKIWNTVNEAWELVPQLASIFGTIDTGWAITNKTEDKTLDCNVNDTLVTSDVVGTLIDVLIAAGILSA